MRNIQDRTGIEVSELSKLENGRRADFTLDMVRCYAQAVGKRVLVTVADATEPVVAGR